MTETEKPRRSSRSVPVPAPAEPIPSPATEPAAKEKKSAPKKPAVKPVATKKKKAPIKKEAPPKKKAKKGKPIVIKKGTPLFDGEDWIVYKRAARKIEEDDPMMDGAWYAKPKAEIDPKKYQDVCEWSGITEVREWAIAAITEAAKTDTKKPVAKETVEEEAPEKKDD